MLTDEQTLVRDNIREWVDAWIPPERANDIDRKHDFSRDLITQLGGSGVLAESTSWQTTTRKKSARSGLLATTST